MIYQGFWKRLLAYIIDTVIWVVIFVIFTLIFSIDVEQENSIFALILSLLISIYFIICPITPLQGTLGKYVLGMKIVDQNGEKISFLRSLGRYFSYLLSGVILYFGYIMIGLTPKKQGLHDMIAKTYVIKR